MNLHRHLFPLAALIIAPIVVIVAAREVSMGRREVGAAQAAAARSDWPEAIARARAAAEAFVPGSPWPDRGRLRLEAIGADAEARGDDETALLAYGALRTAALATRTAIGSLSSSDRWRTTAESGLARVAASHSGPVAPPRPSADSMLNDLRDEQPPGPWTLSLLAAASVAVIGALARLAWPGESARGIRGAQAVALLGFVAYAIILLVGQ
jgi:hypothetical protein